MMRKSACFLLMVSIILVLYGCDDRRSERAYEDFSSEKFIQGKVLQKRNKGITLELTDQSGQRFSDTIHVGVKDEEMLNHIEEGYNLSVWYDFIRESNPPKTTALKIEFIMN
jgi:hypothetical protein